MPNRPGDSQTNLVYLAKPIDFANADTTHRTNALVHEYCDLLMGHLTKQGWCTYQPTQAWTVSGTPRPVVQEVNYFALSRSDLLVAAVPRGVYTLGVPLEIATAVAQGTNVIVVTDHDQSWALAHLRTYTDQVETVSVVQVPRYLYGAVAQYQADCITHQNSRREDQA